MMTGCIGHGADRHTAAAINLDAPAGHNSGALKYLQRAGARRLAVRKADA